MESLGEFDYVVVGAGSAGCVVAARLSESGRHQVAVLEAGGEDNNFWVKMPLGFGKMYDFPKYCWIYESEPEAGLNGATVRTPRGRMLGGTSSINGMVYLRGQHEDFDHWRELGNAGWGYDDVLPYFRKSEDNDRGANHFHGKGGPLGVASAPHHELVDAFVESGIKAGYPRNTDFNGATQEGFGFTQMTARNGQRCSASMAFLHPARSRSNLSVVTHALAQRIVFKDGKAIGVEFKRGDKVELVTARKEVILCGGSFNSPQLLQLSGIGPGGLLQEHDIPVLADLPGVGENLQDHFTAAMSFRCTRKVTINDMMASPLSKISQGLQYLLFRKGLLSTNGHFGTGYVRTDPALTTPDMRFHINLWTRPDIRKRGSADNTALDRHSSFGVSLYILHPDSRGSVRIKSTDSAVAPEIRFNLFQSERDLMTVVKGARIARHIVSLPPVSAYVAGENAPGPDAQSDEALIEFFRAHGRPNNHAIGTCRMGIDNMAVVDPRLRVKGVSGLRVIDASVMPRVVVANTNAATIMIGEKGAAMIVEDARD